MLVRLRLRISLPPNILLVNVIPFILDLSKLTSQISPESPVLYIQNVNLL